MKIVYFGILIFFFVQQQHTNGAVVRKPPAYSTPVYSNSYLPAAMQVIFHAVGQLKHLENENIEEAMSSSTTTTASIDTSPHPPGQHQPIPQHSTSSSITSSEDSLADSEVSTELTASIETSTTSPVLLMASVEVSTVSPAPITASNEISTTSPPTLISSVSMELPDFIINASKPSVIIYENTDNANGTNSQGSEEPTDAVEAETPEENYATPETNHEIQEPVQETQELVQETQEPVQETQEPVQEVQEPVHEMAESNQEMAEDTGDDVSPSSVDSSSELDAQPTTVLPTKEENSAENSSENSSEEIDDEKSTSGESKDESGESKSSEESKPKELDSSEEEDEEIRFTLIGEKVSQVPRPSLSNYLRKTAKSPLRSSVQELATLYDALSKDARRQGLAKYSGYSDEVLKTLASSAEGGVGPQLRTLLEKTLERNELTRDDAKSKLTETLKKLNDPATMLSRDLRRLIPLRYVP